MDLLRNHNVGANLIMCNFDMCIFWKNFKLLQFLVADG